MAHGGISCYKYHHNNRNWSNNHKRNLGTSCQHIEESHLRGRLLQYMFGKPADHRRSNITSARESLTDVFRETDPGMVAMNTALPASGTLRLYSSSLNCSMRKEIEKKVPRICWKQRESDQVWSDFRRPKKPLKEVQFEHKLRWRAAISTRQLRLRGTTAHLWIVRVGSP